MLAGAGMLLAGAVAAPAFASLTPIERISVAADGSPVDNGSTEARISGNGRFVVFQSFASNLVAGDTNRQADVFVRDRAAGSTERVSISGAGVEANARSETPAISADGRFVVFSSLASNLVADDKNGQEDVFVRDRATGTTERVSVSATNVEANAGSDEPAMSGDGRFVVFSSVASNLVPGDTNASWDVFEHDRVTGETERVSVASDGTQANSTPLCGSAPAAINADGRFVAFASCASSLVPGDSNNTWDVFVRDRVTATTQRVSIGAREAAAAGASYPTSISADGRYVVFYSLAPDLVPGDTNETYDVFVRDRRLETNERVSLNSRGTQGNGGSVEGAITPDGRFVLFTSAATNLVFGDANAHQDVFVRDRETALTERVNVSQSGAEADDEHRTANRSDDGTLAAFVSLSSNLVRGGVFLATNVFVRDRSIAPVPLGTKTELIGIRDQLAARRPSLESSLDRLLVGRCLESLGWALEPQRWRPDGSLVPDDRGLVAMQALRTAVGRLTWISSDDLKAATRDERTQIISVMALIARDRFRDVWDARGSTPAQNFLLWRAERHLDLGDNAIDRASATLDYLEAWRSLLGQPPS